MKDINLVYGLSIRERYHILEGKYSGEVVEDYIEQWNNRRSLCSKESFYEYLKLTNTREEEFNLGIKLLDSEDKELLYSILEKQEWFLLNKELFAQQELDYAESSAIDFSYALRYHINYFKKRINDYSLPFLEIDEMNMNKFLEYLAKDLFSISIKTFVSDLHREKRLKTFEGASPEERYHSYLVRRFGSISSIQQFFFDYPVLCRLLAERLKFHLDNYIQFIQGIEESAEEIVKVFSVRYPFKLELYDMDAGDSHCKGKGVTIFKINGRKLVFKFKNLIIGKKFNQFLEFIKKETKSDFYQITRIITDKYTIEEFIESEPCGKEEEVSTYYYRFGEYTAICYFLCGNDFHAENIVAKGSFPVLIDIETLLQNDNPLKELDSVFSIANLKKMQSVLSTSLLPAKYFSNRLEPKNGENQEGVQMSAFNGKGQVLPFKVLQLINPGTDEVCFDYKERWMEASNNLPTLLDQEIVPEKYTDFLLRGFTDQYVFFMENKEKIIRKVNEIFANTEVRNVLKATQQYLDMINYGYHPNCMTDYVEREKLFENLWGFNYRNKSVVAFEINDLLVNDVPIFFNNASSKEIITSNGSRIEGYYSRTAIGRISERISNLSEADFDYQKVLLTTSLGAYNGEEYMCSFSMTPKKQLEEILSTIIQRSVSDSKRNKSVFQDFLIENGKRGYGTLPVDFYDGAAGIYTFLLYYNENYPNQELNNLLERLERMLFENLPETFTSFSVYQGSLSLLIPLYHRIRLFHSEKDKNRAFGIVQALRKVQGDISFQEDWLSGVAGLITVLANLYIETTNREFLTYAQELAEKITLKKIDLCGLSHGYSGVALALNKLNVLIPTKAYSKIILECLANERRYYADSAWTDLREGKNAIAQWCHGCGGIGLVRLELILSGNEDTLLKQELTACINAVVNTTLKKDSLCHGNLGNYAFLRKVLQTGMATQKEEHKIRKKLVSIENKLLFDGVTVEGLKGYPLLGLMNGLSGIGYEWLRFLTDYQIPDLLTLE